MDNRNEFQMETMEGFLLTWFVWMLHRELEFFNKLYGSIELFHQVVNLFSMQETILVRYLVLEDPIFS